MTNEKSELLAKQSFDILCQTLDKLECPYQKEDDLTVLFAIAGEDLPIQFIVHINAERQLVRLYSPLSFKMSEEMRMEGAIATCTATCSLNDGSFDYDLSDGSITFRMTASYFELPVGEELFRYLISYSRLIVDKYNDQFLAISKGHLDIETFITAE